MELPGPGGGQNALYRDYVLVGAVVAERRSTRAGLRLAQFLYGTHKNGRGKAGRQIGERSLRRQ